MCDIDHFKLVNDQFGHAAGDLALQRVAGLLSSVLRTGDEVVRFGGEEFLLVIPGVSLRDARTIAERARSRVAAEPIEIAATRLRLTVSFGVAERRDDEQRDHLIARADSALYAAKQLGRNRVEVEEVP